LLGACVYKDKEVIKLAKRSFLPPLLNLRDRDVVNARFFVFIKNLFICDKKEGFNSKVNNVPLIANTIVDRIVIKSKITS